MLIIFVGGEGYILYRALIVVFDTGHVRRLLLYSLCYGIPILISFSTLLVGLLTSIHKESQYHKDDLCWLNNEYLFIGFYPFLILMLCFNIFILTVGMRIQMKVRTCQYYMISQRRILLNHKDIKGYMRDLFKNRLWMLNALVHTQESKA